jgi:hypothetical protein
MRAGTQQIKEYRFPTLAKDLHNKIKEYRSRHAFPTRKVCISKQSNAQIKENGSRNATPNIAPTTRNIDPECTDQGKRIKEGMQLQTSPQQLGT